ncbi:MAG TPA: hypothetical protein VLE97_01690 [Gaiellaceae bacterium]|nr:hypothetical protein [Gaiellaceae bacterium]
MGNRLTSLQCVQHQGPTVTGGASLGHDQGANKDWVYKIKAAKKGDFIALAIDTPFAHPSMMIAIEMVAGDKESSKWEGFMSLTAENPQPRDGIKPAAEGSYAALYDPALKKNPSDPPPSSGGANPNRGYYIARALADIDDTHCHLVRAG